MIFYRWNFLQYHINPKSPPFVSLCFASLWSFFIHNIIIRLRLLPFTFMQVVVRHSCMQSDEKPVYITTFEINLCVCAAVCFHREHHSVNQPASLALGCLCLCSWTPHHSFYQLHVAWKGKLYVSMVLLSTEGKAQIRTVGTEWSMQIERNKCIKNTFSNRLLQFLTKSVSTKGRGWPVCS